MFRTSIVHLQERSYTVCCNLLCLDTLWGWRKNCSSSFTLITTGLIETYQITTYTIRTLLKMDYWSPKYVELLNVMNKINHQISCILLDYRYIIKWYTVHTISNYQLILCEGSRLTDFHNWLVKKFMEGLQPVQPSKRQRMPFSNQD